MREEGRGGRDEGQGTRRKGRGMREKGQGTSGTARDELASRSWALVMMGTVDSICWCFLTDKILVVFQ